MTPSKSMYQKGNNDFKGKYPYVRMDTLVSMHIIDILIVVTYFHSIQIATFVSNPLKIYVYYWKMFICLCGYTCIHACYRYLDQ